MLNDAARPACRARAPVAAGATLGTIPASGSGTARIPTERAAIWGLRTGQPPP